MDDIVVKPPQNPVARASRISGDTVSPRADSPVKMPIARQPSTLAVSVPIGHSIDHRCAVTLRPYRATDPTNPPNPTRKDMPHGFAILLSCRTSKHQANLPVSNIQYLNFTNKCKS